MGEYKNPPWLNRLAWTLVLGLTLAALAMIVSFF